MRGLIVTLLLTSFAFAAPVPKEVKNGVALEGTWEVVEFQMLGQATNAYNGALWKIGKESMDIEYTATSGLTPVTNKRKAIDTTTTPKSLDYTNYMGQDRKAIFEIDGDKLTLCIPTDPPDRPKELKANETNLFYIFKRVKE
jgi:uncharacterized protein (TIGR03067 family)